MALIPCCSAAHGQTDEFRLYVCIGWADLQWNQITLVVFSPYQFVGAGGLEPGSDVQANEDRPIPGVKRTSEYRVYTSLLF